MTVAAMNPTELLDVSTAGASLNDLRTAFDQALSELPDWKREEAGIVLAALRNTLPPLAGHVDAAYVRKLIGVFVPSAQNRTHL
jgi:hypothetical protein